jgi:superfamily II DNA/RNA helicase
MSFLEDDYKNVKKKGKGLKDNVSEVEIPEFYMNYLKSKMFIEELSLIQKISFYPIFNHLQSLYQSLENNNNLLVHKDILIKSETGSGKTLAFLLPIILSLGLSGKKLNRREGTQGLFEICFFFLIFH